GEADLRTQLPAYGRNQVVDGGQRHHPGQRGDLDTAGAADAPQIVALEIDDHDVLGAVLGGRRELDRGGTISGCVGAAGAGPLDRARLDHAVDREREKSLGRVAEDGDRVGHASATGTGDE